MSEPNPPAVAAGGREMLRAALGRLWALARPRLAALLTWARAHPRTAAVLLAALLVLGFATRLLFSPIDRALTVLVHRGTLTLRLTETGVLRPAQSITYRAPLAGRELEITFLAPEGFKVNEGDLILRLDTGELEAELPTRLGRPGEGRGRGVPRDVGERVAGGRALEPGRGHDVHSIVKVE